MPSPRPACSPHAPCRSSLAAAGSQPAPRPPVSVPGSASRDASRGISRSASAGGESLHVLGGQRVTADRPIAAVHLFQHAPGHLAHVLTLDRHHRIGELLHNLPALRAGENTLNHLDINQRHLARSLSVLFLRCAGPHLSVVNRPGPFHARNTPEPLHPYHYGFQQVEYRRSGCRKTGELSRPDSGAAANRGPWSGNLTAILAQLLATGYPPAVWHPNGHRRAAPAGAEAGAQSARSRRPACDLDRAYLKRQVQQRSWMAIGTPSARSERSRRGRLCGQAVAEGSHSTVTVRAKIRRSVTD